MSNVNLPTLAIGSIPGLLALVGAAIGHGRAMQRLATVERDVAKLSEMNARVATIEERTKNTADNTQVMRDDLGRITDHLLDEGRAFAAKLVTQPRRR